MNVQRLRLGRKHGSGDIIRYKHKNGGSDFSFHECQKVVSIKVLSLIKMLLNSVAIILAALGKQT